MLKSTKDFKIEDSFDDEITFNLNINNLSQNVTSDSHNSTILIPNQPVHSTISSDESLSEFSGFSEVSSLLIQENEVSDHLDGILYNVTASKKKIEITLHQQNFLGNLWKLLKKKFHLN